HHEHQNREQDGGADTAPPKALWLRAGAARKESAYPGSMPCSSLSRRDPKANSRDIRAPAVEGCQAETPCKAAASVRDSRSDIQKHFVGYRSNRRLPCRIRVGEGRLPRSPSKPPRSSTPRCSCGRACGKRAPRQDARL